MFGTSRAPPPADKRISTKPWLPLRLLRPAGEAACIWRDGGLEAGEAHLLEALRALAGDRGRRRQLRGVRARALHRHVPVESHGVVPCLARGAALPLEPLDHEGRIAADVRAARHQSARLALVIAVVEARLGELLPDE